MRKWFRKWLGVEDDVRNLTLEVRDVMLAQGKRIDKRLKELDKLSREDIDIGMRGSSTIILTGVYRNRAYIKFYDVPPDEFRHLVEMLRERHRDGILRNVDGPRDLIKGSFSIWER